MTGFTGMCNTVLFVDENAEVLHSIQDIFIDTPIKTLIAQSTNEALSIYSKEEIAVMLSDNQMTGMNVMEFMISVAGTSPDTIRILMTSHEGLACAVDAVNRGDAFRFVIKPWNKNALIQAVQNAVERYQIIQLLKNEDESALLSVAQTVELKDPYTQGHCNRVAVYALKIAALLGCTEETVRHIKYGSWLHDCGKAGVPEKILNKKGTLNESEFEIIRNHPRWGADIAQQAGLPEAVIKTILHHHERYDGEGYPSGLKGEVIPFEARIVTIADALDAITSDRPYRGGYNKEKALHSLLHMKGSVFDPELIDLFLSTYETLPSFAKH